MLVLVFILFISPITRYLVEKYDVKYTGRQIELGWVYVNPFAGYIHIKNLKIFELKSDSIFFSAKGVNANFAKMFYLAINNKTTNSFDVSDSAKVDKMSAKDTLFVGYLNKRINDKMLFTIQDKCSRIVDATVVNAIYNKLNRDREKAFMSYFNIRGVEKRVKIATGDNNTPFNGFSFYKIEYKGEFPEALIKAFPKMSDLNDESPRKKHRQERNKTSNTLLTK